MLGNVTNTEKGVSSSGFVFYTFSVIVYFTVTMVGNIKNTKNVHLPQVSYFVYFRWLFILLLHYTMLGNI